LESLTPFDHEFDLCGIGGRHLDEVVEGGFLWGSRGEANSQISGLRVI
jgi:hypothetical protein